MTQRMLRSKYLPAINENTSDDSSSDDDGLPSQPLFVIDSKPATVKSQVKTPSSGVVKLASSLQPGIDTSGYIADRPSETLRRMNVSKQADAIFEAKSVLKPGFEQQHTINPFRISKRQKKKQNKVEREKTTGDQWFNMPAPEVSEENKRDLAVLQMRDALDPKRFYKRNSDMKELPKFFQVGTVIGTHADYYSSLAKKDKKNTLVEELLADAQFKKWSKRKYSEVLKKNPYYLKQQRRASRKHNALAKGKDGNNQRTKFVTRKKQRRVNNE